MLIEVTAAGAAAAIIELIRRAVSEGRWRAGIEKDLTHVQDEIKRVESAAANRITKAQSEAQEADTAVESRLDKRLDAVESEIKALREDIGEIKITLGKIVTALERKD